ncbi:hypothetical protein HC928_03510 [bacterium]|nr:hypothetical protein [bacterium]
MLRGEAVGGQAHRTRNKKLVSMDQNMSLVANDSQARLIFENSPIRVIFSHKQGMHVFRDDAAFAHFNEQHRRSSSALPPFHCLFDVQDEAIHYLRSTPTPGELRRFGST